MASTIGDVSAEVEFNSAMPDSGLQQTIGPSLTTDRTHNTMPRAGVTAGHLRKISVEIGISGIDEIKANIAKVLDRAMGERAKKVYWEAAKIAQQEIRDLAPEKTGKLKSAVFVGYGDPKKSNVIVGMDYRIAAHAHWIEYGTSKAPPHPYFRPGVTASRAAMGAALVQGMRNLITEDTGLSVLRPRGPSFPIGGEFL